MILDPGDPLYEVQVNYSTDHLGVDGYLDGSGAISRSHNPPDHHDEHEHTSIILPQNGEDYTSDSPVAPSRPHYWHYPEYRSQPQHWCPPSEHSYCSPSYLKGAEADARGHLHSPPSSKPSSHARSRPPYIVGSVTSLVYRASRPSARVRRPSPMRNRSLSRDGSSTSVSIRQSVHGILPEVPSLPRSQYRTFVFVHPDPQSATTSFGPPPNPKDRLRPITGINRYEKHKNVVIGNKVHPHVFPPVTTTFVQ